MKNKLFYLNLLLVIILLFISRRTNNNNDDNSSITSDNTSLATYYQDDNFLYRYIANEGYYLADVLTKEKSIVIPDEINDIPIVGIYNYAFFNKTYITNICLSSNLKYIEEYTFYHLPNLQYYEWENGLYLGTKNNQTFALINLKNKDVSSFKVHPKTKILLDAFIYCHNLKKITLSSSLSYIQYDAFFNLDNLNYNTYSNGCYLGSTSNPYLVLLKLKDKEVSSFTIHKNNTFILNSFYQCKNLSKLNMPKDLISIGKYAFYGCENLKEIILNDSLLLIDSFAFLDCYNLLKITLPSTINKIKFGSFANCLNLREVIFPDNLKIIEDYAFYSCLNLNELSLPGNMSSISKEAFYKCNNLTLKFNNPLPKEHYIDYWISNNIDCIY